MSTVRSTSVREAREQRLLPSGKAGPEQAWERDITEEPLIKTINNWQFSRVANEFCMEQLPPHLKEEVSFQVWTGLDCFCK